MDKILFRSKEDFNKYKKKVNYAKYYIDNPEKFPCIGIRVYEKSFGQELIYLIETYVYLEDFES